MNNKKEEEEGLSDEEMEDLKDLISELFTSIDWDAMSSEEDEEE